MLWRATLTPPVARSNGGSAVRVLRVEIVGVGPADCLHERLDIVARLGAVIHLIGVLVHVEREDRLTGAKVVVWSAAQALSNRLLRGSQVSSTQPEPPPSALPIATNCARHHSKEPKSRARASASTGPGRLSSGPSPAK